MRATILTFTALVIAGFVWGPSVVAQTGDARVVIMHDVPADGYTYVGNPNTFGYIFLVGGATTVHKDGKIIITQNGAKLYETSGTSSAHDYDALNTFTYTFNAEGPYVVHADVFSGGQTYSAEFNGTVVKPADYITADLKIAKPAMSSTAIAGAPVDFEYNLVDAAGTLLPHTDVVFEVRRAVDNWLLFRVHTHTHEESQKLTYAFPDQGDYIVRLIGFNAFPTPDGLNFLPVTKTLTVKVSQSTPGAPMTPGSPASQTAPAVAAAAGNLPNYQLLVTKDPADGTSNQVGIYGNVRLNTLVYDPDAHQMVQHVNYKATFTDPNGKVIFKSDSLHEYDGNLEVVAQEGVPGDYTLHVSAQRGNWTKTTDIKYTVIAPVKPVGGAGPGLIKATGLDKLVSGLPQHIDFVTYELVGAAGTPPTIPLPAVGSTTPGVLMHSELEVQFNKGDKFGAPLLLNKLHTHGDGHFGIDVTFPSAGTYYLLLDGETLDGEPTPSFYFDKVGGVPFVALTVAQGPELLNVPPIPVAHAQQATKGFAPGPDAALLMIAAIVGLAVAVRRHP